MVLFKPMVIALALALALPALANADSRDSNTFQSNFKKTTSATFAEEQEHAPKVRCFSRFTFSGSPWCSCTQS
jgi:hypothetical protein